MASTFFDFCETIMTAFFDVKRDHMWFCSFHNWINNSKTEPSEQKTTVQRINSKKDTGFPVIN